MVAATALDSEPPQAVARQATARSDPLRTFGSECDQDRVGAHYEIRPVREADLAMLGMWRSRPRVSRWRGAADVEPEIDKLRERRVAMWIAEQRSQPFAFIQDYAVSDWSPHHFDFLPPGSRGMDMYIGEPGDARRRPRFQAALLPWDRWRRLGESSARTMLPG